MAKNQKLSVRSRLTISFMVAVATILIFASFGLFVLVHRSLASQAQNQVDAAISAAQSRLALNPNPSAKTKVLQPHGYVVLQLTNAAGTKVWAATSTISGAPVLARTSVNFASPEGLRPKIVQSKSSKEFTDQLSFPTVVALGTDKGPGLLFGFVYGNTIARSDQVLITGILASAPLLLMLMSALFWLGIGRALAPVDSIRRQADAIASTGLGERIEVTPGRDEIARMATTVNQMLDRLEASASRQKEFISNASHELRSPLTTVLATLERAQANPESEDWSTTAERLLQESRRLEATISDLFWLAKNDERHQMNNRTDVDLDDILYDEATRAKSLTKLRVDVSHVQPTRVHANASMMNRLIRNVVDNAMRHATEVLTFASFYEGDEAVLLINNDGEAIDVATSDQFFLRFVRADAARSRESGGTGLGLTIVQEICTLHGGRARFIESPVGTTIEIRIKLQSYSA
jgi:signal transduction histidine kinase